VFWSDWNREAPKLEWSNFDGSGRDILLQGSSVKLPNSLAIDWNRDELCWADAGTETIGDSFKLFILFFLLQLINNLKYRLY
jgi:nidogen (entactin)